MKNIRFLIAKALFFVMLTFLLTYKNVFGQNGPGQGQGLLWKKIKGSDDIIKNPTTGNTGIGLFNPQHPLHVKGQIFADSIAILDHITIGPNSLVLDAGTGFGGNQDEITSSNGIINFGGSPTFSSITLGIGTTTPNLSFSLDAIGDINVAATKGYGIGGVIILHNEGTGNIFVGENAGSFNTGLANTFVGSSAGLLNSSGGANTFLGFAAGFINASGNNNTFLGNNAGFSNDIGNNNTFIGRAAGVNNNSIANNNTFIGNDAGQSNITGDDNTYIGFNAQGTGIDAATLTNATAVGANASVTASNSLVLGNSANIGIGVSAPTTKLEVAGKTKTNTFQMTAGATTNFILADDGTGTGNVIWKDPATIPGGPDGDWDITSFPGNMITSISTANVGIGTITAPVFKLDVVGSINSSIDYKIGGIRVLSKPGTDNLFVGEDAGTANTSGNKNVFVGNTAGSFNTTGFANSFVGDFAGATNQTGNRNTFLGTIAGSSNKSSFNTFIGFQSGFLNTFGQNNSFLGVDAGFNNVDGSDNTFLGFNAGSPAGFPSLTNATVIGANASVTASNSLVLGNNANVGIGVSAPATKLEVVGKTKTTTFQMTAGATVNFILADDGTGTGNVIWKDPATIPAANDGDWDLSTFPNDMIA